MAASELLENGFAGAAEVTLENGFDAGGEAEVEKGFAGAFDELVELPPKIALPRLGFGAAATSLGTVDRDGLSSFALTCPGDILVPLNALTEPSFLLHCLCLHAWMYSLLSCPGKCSGISLLSCRSSDIFRLQTLQLASEAGGGWLSSIHVCPPLSKYSSRVVPSKDADVLDIHPVG